jgi:nicotinate-nucleotide pyrophosphorylase (carboxylating)
MKQQPLDSKLVHEVIVAALREDLSPEDDSKVSSKSDITSNALLSEETQAVARIFAKEEGVLAGLGVAKAVFLEINECFTFEEFFTDGDEFGNGDEILKISGPARDILTAERTALNFLQCLSGVATKTLRYVKAVQNTGAKILDTRKTTPGLRVLEKHAVVCGGGVNHRMGLYDEFLIKDNHVELMKKGGGLAEAVRRARKFNPAAKLIVEADTLEQVAELVEIGVDQILLDNMSNAQIMEAVRMVAGRCKVEASGGMTLDRVPGVAAMGVDFISVGALTHHIRSIDFSLDIFES